MSDLTIGEAFRRTNYLRVVEILESMESLDESEARVIEILCGDLQDKRRENERYNRVCDGMGTDMSGRYEGVKEKAF